MTRTPKYIKEVKPTEGSNVVYIEGKEGDEVWFSKKESDHRKAFEKRQEEMTIEMFRNMGMRFPGERNKKWIPVPKELPKKITWLHKLIVFLNLQK